MKIRPERVAQRIQREIADILEHRLRDPRLSQWVSVTGVEVNGDLSLAKIYVTVVQPQGEERERTLETLAGAAGFVRRELAPRLGLREMPEIRFVADESLERGARVEELLRRIHRGETIDDQDEPA